MTVVVPAEFASGELRRMFFERMRIVVVGGISAGVLLVGVGSRVAMMVLRLTSPHGVRGVESDDGFTIGEVTLFGTYNLLALGALVGIIGAVAYRLVARWLIGPSWFRRLTTGLAAAVVAGSMLVHADGIDFRLLEPKVLAIGLFILLPGLFGTFIGVFVDSVAAPDSWTTQGRRRWLLPAIAVACFPATLIFLVPAAVIVWCGVMLTEVDFVHRLRANPVYALVLRATWLGIAVLGLIALVHDIDALT